MKTVCRLFVLNGTAYDGKDRIGKPTVPVLDRTNGTAKTNGTVRAINTNRPYLFKRPNRRTFERFKRVAKKSCANCYEKKI